MPPPPFPSPPQPYDKSNYQLLKEGGWNNMHDFMRSYDLKTWEPNDYGTAKQILEGFREIDQKAWEEQYNYHDGGDEGWDDHGDCGDDYGDYGDQGDYGYH